MSSDPRPASLEPHPASATELLAELASHPFADGLDARQVEAIGKGATAIDLAPWEHLFVEGRRADRAYLVVSGHIGLEVHVHPRGAVAAGSVGPGELLGWSWLLEPQVWRFDARARTSARVLALDTEVLRRACDADHRLDRLVSHQVIQTLAVRLEAARHQILDVYRHGE